MSKITAFRKWFQRKQKDKPCPRCGATDWKKENDGLTWCQKCRFWYEGFMKASDFNKPATAGKG